MYVRQFREEMIATAVTFLFRHVPQFRSSQWLVDFARESEEWRKKQKELIAPFLDPAKGETIDYNHLSRQVIKTQNTSSQEDPINDVQAKIFLEEFVDLSAASEVNRWLSIKIQLHLNQRT